MEKVPYGYVYRTVNLINGNTYIGQRRLRSDKNWYAYTGSGKLIKAAVKKYGRKNFAKHFVGYAFTKSELDLMEIEVMREEKKRGKAEYNIFVGAPSFPFHNTWGRLSEEEKQQNRKKLSKRKKDLAAARYRTFVEDHGEEALTLYSIEKNVLKVAKSLGVSRGHVSRLLKERNVELNHQNVAGRKLPLATREKIRQTAQNRTLVIQKKCKGCESIIPSERRKSVYCSASCRSSCVGMATNVSKAELSEMVLMKKMSITEICSALGCKKSTLYGLLNNHKLPTPTKILP